MVHRIMAQIINWNYYSIAYPLKNQIKSSKKKYLYLKAGKKKFLMPGEEIIGLDTMEKSTGHRVNINAGIQSAIK